MKKLVLSCLISISTLFSPCFSVLPIYSQTLENHISMKVNESVIIQLPEPVSGPDYSWQLGILPTQEHPNNMFIKLEKSEVVNGMRQFTIKAMRKGSTALRAWRWQETDFFFIYVDDLKE